MCSDKGQDSLFLRPRNFPCTVRQRHVNRNIQMNKKKYYNGTESTFQDTFARPGRLPGESEI